MENVSGSWVALVRDLMFVSKMTASSRATGVAVQVVRDPTKLADVAGAQLLVDLSLTGALEAAVAWKARTGGRVIGFVSHVLVDQIAAARAAGLDEVMSNGALAGQLDRILTGQ